MHGWAIVIFVNGNDGIGFGCPVGARSSHVESNLCSQCLPAKLQAEAYLLRAPIDPIKSRACGVCVIDVSVDPSVRRSRVITRHGISWNAPDKITDVLSQIG